MQEKPKGPYCSLCKRERWALLKYGNKQCEYQGMKFPFHVWVGMNPHKKQG